MNSVNALPVLFWRRMRSHVHMPAHVQIALGEPKAAHLDKSYLPHTTCKAECYI